MPTPIATPRLGKLNPERSGAEGGVASLRQKPRLFLDVSFTMRYGLAPAVGLLRVEHYLARALSEDPSVDFHYVLYDSGRGAYRPLTLAEQDFLRTILYRHELDSEATHAPPRVPSDRISPLSGLRHQPRRTLRSRGISRVGRYLVVPLNRLGSLIRDPKAQAREAVEEMPEGGTPQFGDVLISAGDMWEYIDYSYLYRLCRRQGVSLLAVVYDVIAVELPFTTLGPPHVYHRYWVELGHIAARLLAISEHTAHRYRRVIAEPNDLTVPITYAHLPNFLKESAASTGEREVPNLTQRPFVLYCSTIEMRKNHQLLLHIWDRLRQELSPDDLPILVFAGKWGWNIEIVRLLVERNWRLRPHLRILDHVCDAELIWLYRKARFTVFPSYDEGFGLAAAESLSFGTPVIVSSSPALIEATEGLMPSHDPYDFNAWYADIRDLATDDTRLAILRCAAAKFRGPAYDEFAGAVCQAACVAVSQSQNGSVSST